MNEGNLFNFVCPRANVLFFSLTGLFKVDALHSLQPFVKVDSSNSRIFNPFTLFKVLSLIQFQSFEPLIQGSYLFCLAIDYLLEMLVILVFLFLGKHESAELFELSFQILSVLVFLEMGEMLGFGNKYMGRNLIKKL